MARKKGKKASRKSAATVEVEEKTEEVDEDQEVLDAIKKAEEAVEKSESRKAEEVEAEEVEAEEVEAEAEEVEAEAEEVEAEAEEVEAEAEEAEAEPESEAEPEAELEVISEIEEEIDGSDTSDKETDEDTIGISEMSTLLQRSEMRCKKFCRDELSKSGGAKKEGGSWKISRKAVEELSTQIERYTLTIEDVAKRLEISEDAVQKLIDDGTLKAEEKDEKTLISKKSVSFYQKKD